MASSRPHFFKLKAEPSSIRLGSGNRSGGFTLVEVALAIGIVAFAFITLLALLPAGQTAYRRAIDISTAAQIAQRVIGDAQQADFEVLIDAVGNKDVSKRTDNYTFRAPSESKPEFRYFDDQGREVVVKTGGALDNGERQRVIYYVNTRVTPRALMPRSTVRTSAKSEKPPLALVTVQVIHNPSHLNLEALVSKAKPDDISDPNRNLIVLQKGKMGSALDMYTYSAYVGRNN